MDGKDVRQMAEEIGRIDLLEILKEREKSFNEEAEDDLTVVKRSSRLSNVDVVTFDVSGSIFMVPGKILEDSEGSLFSRMLEIGNTVQWPGIKRISKNEFKIDRNPILFSKIIDLVRAHACFYLG